MRRRDTLGRIETIGLTKATASRIPGLPPADVLKRQLVLIDQNGEILGGADAIAKLATLLPSTTGVGRLLSLPGIKQVARLVYRAVAGSRYRLSRLLKLT